MDPGDRLKQAITAELTSRPELQTQWQQIRLERNGATVVLAGEVDDIKAKRLLARLARAAANDIRLEVLDRLRVKVTERRDDGKLANDLLQRRRLATDP